MCLFCKIINGEIPSYKIYEDEFTLAFLDISQETKGHTLVLPKKHIKNIFELDDETAIHLTNAILKTISTLKTKLNFYNINILNNSGELAGQTVHHLHIHLIPQHEDDHFSFNHPQKEPNFEELEKLHKILLDK